MVWWQIKNITRSYSYFIALIFLLLIFSIVQLLPTLFQGIENIGADFISGIIVLNNNVEEYRLIVSFIVPIFIILIATYDDINRKDMIERYTMPRFGKSNYIKSRAIAVGIITIFTFIVIYIFLILALYFRYGFDFIINSIHGSPDIIINSSSASILDIEILIFSVVVQSIVFSIVAIGMFILANVIRTKRIIDTIVLIEVIVIILQLLLMAIAGVVGYTNKISSTFCSSGGCSIVYKDSAGVIGLPGIILNSSGNTYSTHIEASLFTLFFTILIFLGIPLFVLWFKEKVTNKTLKENNKSFEKYNKNKLSIFQSKLPTYLLYILPVFLFLFIYRLLFEFLELNLDYSVLNIETIFSSSVISINQGLYFYIFYGLVVLYVIMAYQIIRETDIYYNGQVYVRLIRYKSKYRYLFDVLKVTINKVIPYMILFPIITLLLFEQSTFSYTGFITVMLPLMFSFIILALIVATLRIISSAYVSLIITCFVFIVLKSFFTMITLMFSGSSLQMLLVFPMFNYEIISILNKELIFGVSNSYVIRLFAMQALQAALLCSVYFKLGQKKYKEFK